MANNNQAHRPTTQDAHRRKDEHHLLAVTDEGNVRAYHKHKKNPPLSPLLETDPKQTRKRKKERKKETEQHVNKYSFLNIETLSLPLNNYLNNLLNEVMSEYTKK